MEFSCERISALTTFRSTVLCLLIHLSVGVLISKPENTVALLHNNITLKCKSDENRKLSWYSICNNSESVELWNGYYQNPKACPLSCCQIDNHEPGKYNLNITAREETAKQYTCIEPGTFMRASAELIVIESQLKCASYEVSNAVVLSCAIRFYGKWNPQIKWNNSNGESVDVVNVFENGTVTSNVTLPLTSVVLKYTAVVYFDEADRPARVTATNVPSYTDSWTLSSIESSSKDFSTYVGAFSVAGGLAAGVIGMCIAWFAVRSRKSRKGSQKMEDIKTRTRLV